MVQKITKEELAVLLEKKRSGARKEIQFAAELESLKKGESILITKDAWASSKIRTKINAYYYGKLRKGIPEDQRKFDYQSLAAGFVITRL
jgi:hypothetical protein